MTLAAAPALAIDVHALNKSFGDKHVVIDLSMQVKRGEIFGFLGPNGSGKTTSIRMMCGLLTADTGGGTCLGFDLRRQTADIKRQVGYMTQRFSFWEDLSIRENLDFIARLYQMPQRHNAVAGALQSLGLAARADQLTGALSGGWKQRLALAACTLHRPSLLLLDEPTAGVDPMARRDFWEELHRLAASGVSVLVSTHYMDEAERCHKLAYLSNGRLLVQGSAAEIIAAEGLTTWIVRGGDLIELASRLRSLPGVQQTSAFGADIHVSGHDGELLERTLRAELDPRRTQIQQVPTNLEDVFMSLMSRSRGGPERLQ